MKNIARQASLIMVYIAVIYIALMFTAFKYYSDDSEFSNMDNFRQNKVPSLFLSGGMNLSANMYKLWKQDKKQIFLIGGSNVGIGFRPEELEQYYEGYRINNLANSSANNSTNEKIMDIIISAVPEESLKKSIFVIGVWYACMVEDRLRWNERSDIQTFNMFSLYKENGPLIEPVYPKQLYPYISYLMRPAYLLLNVFSPLIGRDVIWGGRSLFNQNKHIEYPLIDEAYKKATFEFWDSYMSSNGIISQEQFLVLERICKKATSTGARVIIVDMPIPNWHAEGSIYYNNYRNMRKNYYARMKKIPGVTYIDLQQKVPESSFDGSVHPRIEATKEWSKSFWTTYKEIRVF